MKNLYYGWVLVAIAAGILATQSLVFLTFGVFLTPLTAEFNWERGALSGALSICMLLIGLFGILSGRLSDKYGPRILVTVGGLLVGTGLLLMSQVGILWQVYLIWGLFIGIGGSCCFIPVTSTIPRWFVKHRGTAIGITFAGFGLGGIIAPPLAQWLIYAYGWRQAFLILGLVTLIIIIPLAQFMKHSPQRSGLKPYRESEAIEDSQSTSPAREELSLAQAIKTGGFWIFGLTMFCIFFTIQTIIVHITPYAIDIGISAIVAASILSIISAISVIGRLSIGFISNRIGSGLALSACLIMITLAAIWLQFAKGTWTFYLFAVLFGLAFGGIVPLQTIVPAELFGIKFLGAIMGGLMLLGTTGGALGPPLAGSIFDITRSYSLAFIICIILGGVSVLLNLILLRYRGKKRYPKGDIK